MAIGSLSAIVLAGGDGTRMKSNRPKPIHVLCGKAMVLYELDALHEIGVRRTVVVVGTGAERVTKKLQEDGPDLSLEFVEQRFIRGTGDAASVGVAAFGYVDDDDAAVLVLPGDTPLVRAATLSGLVAEHRGSGAAVTILSAELDDPSGYSRIVRGKTDRVVAVIDEADVVDEPIGRTEVSAGIYCFRLNLLAPALRRVTPRNIRGVHLLSDVVRVLADAGHPVSTHRVSDITDTYGVNDRVQLARVEAELRRRTNHRWLERGVTLVDPAHTYIDTTVHIGADVTVFPGTMLQGRTVIGEGADIGPNTRLVDCAVGAGARVEETVGHDAEIGPGAVVGPFAVLQPGDAIAPGLETGAFYTSPTRET
ncbi:MAG: NTP transferase domain-containing protein [Actinobacteria bacterium]|uniref:UDP-N-acetylglucosamine diphosphorylase n=1 Tax=freshwater metagenome TaxID=449393 RepID=A0A6J7AU73_9ZZZZ|nr:NTP transferase domain-containing protein [Actinomycetota bacterium]MSW92640.1 NTP transferase domain-containing protein [Actinomycetota bacterium]MSX88421.1 NTP transferase domain-containing protein [Actinomycetota bacterium]MSY71092.1 NTP transferase domain-containing protein [Actinomycetota bacterium]